MKYVYLLVYAFSDKYNSSFGHGNQGVLLDSPITLNTVRIWEKRLLDEHPEWHRLIITNAIPMENYDYE